ncbi:unnamed protein product [Blepharisma stoltei]|uniref:PX domain-containing protein n=1 Tax=Blepharisma stoltei TaxID=1481888 RepID=A0AAU9K8Q5_9CILI|nr:unnamed protein product [Blepharisma stoltei]
MSRFYIPNNLSTIYEASENSHSNTSTLLTGTFILNSVEIHVSNPIIQEDSPFSRHVLYLVHGEDSSGPFEVHRRYSDFQTLRTQLQLRWPGCFIPPTPPKKYLGNFSATFIESRRSFLEMFVGEISKINFLYTCEDFQNFIRGKGDYEKSIYNQKPSISDLAIVYQSIFSEFVDIGINDEMLVKMQEHENFLKANLSNLNAFKKNAKNIYLHADSLNMQWMNLNEKIKEIEGEYIKKMKENQENQKIKPIERHNPFRELYEWAKLEVMNVNAMIETIQTKHEYNALRHVKQKEFKKATKNIVKTDEPISGTEYVQKFVNKLTKRSEGKISILGKEIDDLELILHIITVRLCEEEIPNFKAARTKEFERMVEKYSKIINEGFNNISGKDSPLLMKFEEELTFSNAH